MDGRFGCTTLAASGATRKFRRTMCRARPPSRLRFQPPTSADRSRSRRLAPRSAHSLASAARSDCSAQRAWPEGGIGARGNGRWAAVGWAWVCGSSAQHQTEAAKERTVTTELRFKYAPRKGAKRGKPQFKTILAPSFDESFIFVVCANPHPDEIVTIFNRKCSVVESSSNRRKFLEAFPEPTCSSMHLEVLELAALFFLEGFFDQEIQSSCF
jgi:hypothetical protein